VSGLKYNSGKNNFIGQANPIDKGTLNPSLYGGMIIYHTDKQIYFSNGSVWSLIQSANVDFSFTGNNTLFMNGKQQSQLSVNNSVYSTNATFAYTANNSTYAYGKQEAQLSVNAATFAINSVSASLSVTANNSTYAYGKQESQLSVANSALSNNSTYAYGKQEAQLSVANSALSNNSTYAYGKQESQLSVSAANNSSFLLGRTWASPANIGTSVASNGIFTNVTVLNNLTVNGTMTVVNTSITTTNNTFIILNDGQATPFNDIGFVFQRYTSPSNSDYNVVLYWEENTKQLVIGKANTVISTNSQNINTTTAFLTANANGEITIDGRLIANVATIDKLTINTLIAGGSSGTARQFLAANGAGGTYWYAPFLPIAKDNTSSIKYYLPMSNSASGDWTNAVISDTRLSFTPSTGTLTANQGAFTDIIVSSNSYINKLFANGSVGGIGQVLVSNGAGIYWENSLTVAPRAGYGLSSNNTHYQVNANSGITANGDGTFVNTAYIATITSNNATYAYGKQEAQLSVNASVYATNSQFAYIANNSNYANVALIANNSTYLAGRTWASPLVIGADVANSAFFSNTTVNRSQIGVLIANGSVGTFGQILASNSTGIYWTSNPPGIALPLTQNNTSTSTWYFPMSNSVTGSWANAAVADGGLSFVPSTGVLRISTANVGKAIIANAVITGIFANGTFGTADQVLSTNGSYVYWSGDTKTIYKLIGVSNTVQNVGILRLTSSTLSNNDVLFVGRGTTVVSSNTSQIVFATQDQYSGTVTSITSGNGLVGSPITVSGTLAVGSGAGISVNTDDVAVNAKDGLIANASGLYVNNDFIRTLSLIAIANNATYLNSKIEGQLNANSALVANNSTYAYGKQESQLRVANAVFATTAQNVLGSIETANNATYAYGKQESQLSVNNSVYVNGKQESQLRVANAVFATVANSVLGSISLANNATYAYGKQESQLSVATSNNATYAYGKQESQLYVANAVFATVANSVLGLIETANNAAYAYGKQQGQLSVNNSIYVNGKQESQLYVANAVFATVANSVLGSISLANNSTYAYGKQESQLSVANAVFATTAQNVLGSIATSNNSTHAYGKQESQLAVASATIATTSANAGFATTANNALRLNGKQESQLVVSYADLANNASYAYGIQQSQLSVATANNATSAYGKQETQLNVGLLNSQTGTYYADIPARLGYTPVQQGTGTGQGTNAVKIGWSNSVNGQSSLRLTIDGTDYGNTWPISITGGGGSGGSYTFSTGLSNNANTITVNAAYIATITPNNAANAALLNSQNGAYYTNATNLNAGLVPTARLATGTADSTSYLRGDQTWATIPSSTVWSSNITWNGGINIGIAAESSFDLSGSGIFGVNDGGSGYSIKSAIGAQVEIGQAGSRGLYVYGAITASGNITAYSDIKIKKNIEVIPNALDKVSQIRGVTFERTDIESDKRYTGVIAQEIEAVLPEVVQEDSKGIKTVAYGNIVGLLIEAIKELKAEIEELKSK